MMGTLKIIYSKQALALDRMLGQEFVCVLHVVLL